MRTVEDLRGALASLESQAPAVDDLLVRSSRTTSPVERRPRRWLLPIAAAGATVAVVLGANGLAGLRRGTGQSTGASDSTSRPAATGQGRLLPFRLTSALPQLKLLDAHSNANPATSYGTAVVAEYGMEVTINVSTATGQQSRSAGASRVAVGDARGWIDVTCGLRAAVSVSAAAGHSPANPDVSTFNDTCSLFYDSGPWHVAIYVAGPGGGSRKITRQQFLQIGDRLQLADSPSDSSTWFAADELLPN